LPTRTHALLQSELPIFNVTPSNPA
jgi:hypothetical protein